MVTDEIRQLLAAPCPPLDDVDATLTAGYAEALQLEAERWRLEQRLGEVAASLADPANVGRTEELTMLSKRLTAANESITSLRALLTSLRDKRSELRIAS
jgi:hypothetical protein